MFHVKLRFYSAQQAVFSNRSFPLDKQGFLSSLTSRVIGSYWSHPKREGQAGRSQGLQGSGVQI